MQAEGLIALCTSAVVNGDAKHWELFKTLFAYVKAQFIQPDTGEWITTRTREGGMLCDHLGSLLKGAYHVPRCLMRILTLLEPETLS